MKKLTRQQKQDVNFVLTKYGTKNEGIIPTSLASVAVFSVADLIVSGGVASLANLFLFTAGGAGTGFLMGKSINCLQNFSENKASQKYKATYPVVHALQEMEDRLSKSFSLAARDARSKQAFEAARVEVLADLEKLSPAFEIVSGGPNGYGTERYEFVLAREQPKTPVPVITTLSAIAQKQEMPAPPTTSPATKALLKIAGL